MLDQATINRLDFNGRFSRIVDTGKTVYFSGVLARNTEDIETQTQDVLDQIDDLLANVGLTKSNLVCANIWLADITQAAQMNAVWERWVDPQNAPVRATVESKLARPESLIEIQVQAMRD